MNWPIGTYDEDEICTWTFMGKAEGKMLFIIIRHGWGIILKRNLRMKYDDDLE
jgi:hypothetical protein